jgi:hypothetical protein
MSIEDYKDGLPSSEDLDAIVREQEIADAIVTKVNESVAGVCTTCGELSIRICTHCGQEYCSQHFCITHEMLTERVAIVDEDGTEHRGQRVRLIGEGWPDALQRLDSLTDEQLEERIAGLKKLLKQAIETQDYAQISLAAHEFKLDYRKHSRYVAAIKRREKIQQGTLRLNNKKHRMDASGQKQTIPPDIAALMKLGNLSYEKAVEMKAILMKAKG